MPGTRFLVTTDLSLLHESLNQVLVDDAVGGSKEGEHVGDEVPLVVLQVHPVTQVLVIGFIYKSLKPEFLYSYPTAIVAIFLKHKSFFWSQCLQAYGFPSVSPFSTFRRSGFSIFLKKLLTCQIPLVH